MTGLHELKLDWTTIHSVQAESKLQSLLQQYSIVFSEEAGKLETFKEAMKRADPQKVLSTRVSRFLFKYRLTPHSTTGISPAELLLGHRPHSHFDFMVLNLATKVRHKQFSHKI